MPRVKRHKRRRISSKKKEDTSKIIEDEPEEKNAADHEAHKEKCDRRREKSAKQVHFALLPDKYEPLREHNTDGPVNQESNENPKRNKYKKFRKNFGKALRYSWKCLVVGLQSFSTAYSGPLSAGTTMVPEVCRMQPRA